MSLSDQMKARIEQIEETAHRNLPKAAEAFEETLRATLSTPGVPESPSLPGQAPHRVTGKLVNSIKTQVNQAAGTVSIGPTINYAAKLEATRPFYDLTIEKCRLKLIDLLLKPKAE